MESRKVEFAIGLFSHPQVVKFINDILKTKTTELNRNYTIDSGNQIKSIPFGSAHSANNPFNSRNPFGGSQQLYFGAASQQSTQSIEPPKEEEISFKVEPQQIYSYNSDDKKKIYDNIFSISTYYCQNDSMTGKPRILLMSSPETMERIRNQKISIPTGFTKQEDFLIFNKYIIGLGNLPEIVKRNDQGLMYEFHLFIEGFEYLMKEYIIPMMCYQPPSGPFGSGDVNCKMFNDLNLATLMAFGNEFQNTPLALNHYILAKKSEKQIANDKRFIEEFSGRIQSLKQDFPQLNGETVDKFVAAMDFEKIKMMYNLYN